MEDMLWSFFLEHGWKLTLIALSGIPFLGILKRTHLFDKIQSKNTRKALFECISSMFSIVVSLIYLLAIDKFNFGKFVILTGGILMLNQTAYAIFENLGIRDIVNKGIDTAWDFIKKLIISKSKKYDNDDSSDTEQIEQNDTTTTIADNDEHLDIIDDLPKDDT